MKAELSEHVNGRLEKKFADDLEDVLKLMAGN